MYVETFFTRPDSDDDECEEAIIKLIDGAESHIDAAIYTLTDDDVAAAIARARNRGLSVRMLMDKTQSHQPASDDETLADIGVEIRFGGSGGVGTGSMHHKFIVVDGEAVGTGSYNWSARGGTRNAENFIVVRLSYVTKSFTREFGRLWDNAA